MFQTKILETYNVFVARHDKTCINDIQLYYSNYLIISMQNWLIFKWFHID